MQGQLDTLITSASREALEAHDALRTELAVLNETMKRDKDRLDRTVLRSPMKGIVNKINVDTRGQVIGSGEVAIEIVPLNDTLIVQANIRPEDISFIHSNQEAVVKFTAYDFTRYGGLEGTVEYIGVDTVSNELGESHYPIRVRTNSNSLGVKDGQELSIIPGMVAEIDFKAGQKTVLQYLLTPINRARERALREH